MDQNLAIIIPAYKGAYLKRTLDSLVQQTNKNFSVYIGDDCRRLAFGSHYVTSISYPLQIRHNPPNSFFMAILYRIYMKNQ